MVQGEESSWRMASAQERAVSLNQALAYGVQAHASAAPPASFLDFQPAAAAAAYFGELEEALIHGANAGVDHAGMMRSDVLTKSSWSSRESGEEQEKNR